MYIYSRLDLNVGYMAFITNTMPINQFMVKDGSFNKSPHAAYAEKPVPVCLPRLFATFAALFHLHLIGFCYMSAKYQEYQQLNLPAIGQEILSNWHEKQAF